MAQFRYRGTLSSGGRQVTSATNTEIFFTKRVNAVDYAITVSSLAIESYVSPITIRLNNEETIHVIPAASVAEFSDIPITKVTILESGVEYSWTAMHE